MAGSSAARIDLISLRVPGVEPELAVRLARLVAERLASGLALGPGEVALECLRVEITHHPEESPESLASRIAAQVMAGIGGALEAAR